MFFEHQVPVDEEDKNMNDDVANPKLGATEVTEHFRIIILNY